MNVSLYDGDPAQDSREFRRCLGQFSTGVTVITGRAGETLVGMTVNSFSSVSLDPPLVLWLVDKKSSRFLSFQSAPHFAINVLAENQVALSRHFGRAAHQQFANVEWTPGKNGAPLLAGAAAVFECARDTLHEAGDHIIVVGRVTRAILFERRVLLFSQGRYRIPADHPDDVIPVKSDDPPQAVADSSLMLSYLFRANHRLSAAFARFREGMTRDQHRVLIGIERHPDITFDQLSQETFLGVQATEDSVAALLADGSIVSAAGKYNLTEHGRSRRSQLMEHLADMEHELLKDVPKSLQDAGRQVLQILAGD
jgi:flavin reductase (DIM6/NTAB) family NADH-FMN oxidoreductase RutF/DNA-binding MarR family transcriptional regulator